MVTSEIDQGILTLIIFFDKHTNQHPDEVKRMKTIIITCVLLSVGWISSCSTIYDVRYDYDNHTDFQTLKTYDWMPIPDGIDTNSLVVQRVKNATEPELETKGLVKAPSAPDFLIVQHISTQEHIDVTNWGYGYGPYYRYGGGYWGPGGVPTYSYEEGTLVLDFVDPATKQLLWRGSAKADIDYVDSPEESWELIEKAVKEILKQYPPSQK
jgi:hypothetical protein